MRRKFFRSNKFAFILAVFLAIILWLIVTGNDTVPQEKVSREFREVPLQHMELDKELALMDMPSTVDVVLRGPEEDFRELDPEHLVAFVDFKNKESGSYSLPVRVYPPFDLEVIACSPSTVEVILEELDTRYYSVEVAYLGDPVPREPEVILDPSEIVLQGAASRLEEVETVIVKVDPTAVEEDTVHRNYLKPVPLDGERDTVEGIRMEPEEVEVTLKGRPEEER